MKFVDSNGTTIIEVDETIESLEFPRLEQQVTCVNLAEGIRLLRQLRTLHYAVSRRRDAHELRFLTGLAQLTELGVGPLLFGQDVTPVSTCTGLQRLRLINMVGIDVRPLAKLASLEELHLDGAAKYVASLRGLDRLRKLSVTSAKGLVLDHFQRNSALKTLSLVSSSFRGMPSFPELRELDIRSTNVAALQELGRQPSVRLLRLSRCAKLTSIEGIHQFPNLAELELNDLPGLPSLRPLCDLPNLKVLRLSRTHVAIQTLKPLAAPPQLESVITSRENVELAKEIAEQLPACRIEIVGSSQVREIIGAVRIRETSAKGHSTFSIDQDLSTLMSLETNDEVEDLLREYLSSGDNLDEVVMDSEASSFVANAGSIDPLRHIANAINTLIHRKNQKRSTGDAAG